jgi:hypothetical protein
LYDRAMAADRYQPPPFCAGMSLRNFRGFEGSGDIPLAPLTFFVGPNSSGKSSLSDALLLIAQSGLASRNMPSQRPNWSGQLVDLGSFNDTVYRHLKSRTIGISIDYTSDFLVDPWRQRKASGASMHPAVRMTFTFANTIDTTGRLRSMRMIDLKSGVDCQITFGVRSLNMRLEGRLIKQPPSASGLDSYYYLERFLLKELSRAAAAKRNWKLGSKSALVRLHNFTRSYFSVPHLRQAQRVSSGRAAPRRWYSLGGSTGQLFRTTVPTLFDSVDPQTLRDEARRAGHSGRRLSKETLARTLRELEIATSISDRRLSAYHSAIYVTDAVTGVVSNLIDVGFGASQVIPVIEACLSRAAGPLIVEQPEIHLHPKAQGTVAELLCETSRHRQVLVETHSVHFINHARILVARGILPPAHVIVNYVYRTRKGSKIHTIPIDSNGDFTKEWPEGFFDERYQDTLTLLEIKAEREEQN